MTLCWPKPLPTPYTEHVHVLPPAQAASTSFRRLDSCRPLQTLPVVCSWVCAVAQGFWCRACPDQHQGRPHGLAPHVPVWRQRQHHCVAAGQPGQRQGGAADLQGGHEQQQAWGHPALLLLCHQGPAVCAAAKRGKRIPSKTPCNTGAVMRVLPPSEVTAHAQTVTAKFSPLAPNETVFSALPWVGQLVIDAPCSVHIPVPLLLPCICACLLPCTAYFALPCPA